MTPRYLLDTNVISEAQKLRPSAAIVQWLARRPNRDLFICSIVLGEVWTGILELPEGARKLGFIRWFGGRKGPAILFAGRILPFDDAAALVWAEFLADGRRTGHSRSAVDMQIALVDMQRRVQSRVPLPWIQVDPEWQKAQLALEGYVR